MVPPRLKRSNRKAGPDPEVEEPAADPDGLQSDAEQEDHEAESFGSKMDISDEDDEALNNDKGDRALRANDRSNARRPRRQSRTTSASQKQSDSPPVPMTLVDNDVPEFSGRHETSSRASRSQSLQSARGAAVSSTARSSSRKQPKVTLKLPRMTSEDSEMAETNLSKTRGKAGGGRGRGTSTSRVRAKGKGKAKESPTLAFTIPTRSTRASASERFVSSQGSPSRSASKSSGGCTPESEDEPTGEAGDGMDIGQAIQANDVEIESEDNEDIGDDDDDIADEDSEVSPGDIPGRMTARQAVLASMVGAEHVQLGSSGPSKKKQLTSEEIALRREETARKRKNLNEKKLEDEKTETINRLLKKQSSRSRAKRTALNSSVVPTPQSPHSGNENENDSDGVGANNGGNNNGNTNPSATDPKHRTIPGPTWRWISTQQGFILGIPKEATPVISVTTADAGTDTTNLDKKPPPPATCDVGGCNEKRKYRLVSNFKMGACGMPHLKILEGNV